MQVEVPEKVLRLQNRVPEALGPALGRGSRALPSAMQKAKEATAAARSNGKASAKEIANATRTFPGNKEIDEGASNLRNWGLGKFGVLGLTVRY